MWARLLVVEVGTPLTWRPGRFRSDRMTRVWFGPFAVAVVRKDLYSLLDDARTGRSEWRSS